jgi:hypothetical protein
MDYPCYLPCHSNSQPTTSPRHNTQTRVSTHCTIQLRNLLSKCLMPTGEVCVSRPLYILLQQCQVWNHFSTPRTCISSRTGSSRKQDIRARTYNAYFLWKWVLTHWDIRRIINYNTAFFHIIMKYFQPGYLKHSRNYATNRKMEGSRPDVVN